MESMHMYGLLTRKERAKIGISSPFENRIKHGDGIFNFHFVYGSPREPDCDTGLIVARLLGDILPFGESHGHGSHQGRVDYRSAILSRSCGLHHFSSTHFLFLGIRQGTA